ncbi:MAG: 6-carboxytetrahydropterin synthase QueD [Elusimicrobiota bacterium]|jgi:6-pyruvoyltetrahydropterin/6-carboxytetrahydropterin synthase|nr:6-carboxytetrahydropterin synthase QueD [Elusimicrobiota bacterium]
MRYKVSVTKSFAGAHFLRNYKGKCENLHGHNWKVKVVFGGDILQENGMLIDFTDVKKELEKITSCLDHKFLNETVPFDKLNPTAENIAEFIFEKLKKCETAFAKICQTEVWENETSSALFCL